MAVLLLLLLIISAIVLTSAISVAATDADKKRYEVTTLLDGNKLGVSFNHLYEDTNGGPSVVALDSTSSSIHRVSLPISQSSVIERISGGKEGYRDGPANEALFNRPKRLALDSDGTIYVADTKNGAVRMITRAGLVTTIAGGTNRTGHNDGEGSEVTFSNDFDVTYLCRTCTLAIADRGNRMIREIQLPQFIGRCSHATPSPPGNTFTSAAVLMVAFLVGIVAGVIPTILMISTRQLEQVQSRLPWAGNNPSPQLARLIDFEDDDSESHINPPGEGYNIGNNIRNNNAGNNIGNNAGNNIGINAGNNIGINAGNNIGNNNTGNNIGNSNTGNNIG